MPTAEYITRPDELKDVSTALRSASWFALDTEFMRERTYFARACLIQVATDDVVALIDPLALENMTPLLEVLYLPEHLKVLHAARQDLELFFDLRGAVPQSVFDTQIAAGFLGYDDQVGYASLVEAITGVVLDKSHTRTDWAARPLRPEQLRYAAADVEHLREVYASVRAALLQRGRLSWVEEECARLGNPALYANSLETVHLRLKRGFQFPPAVQQVLRALLVWREETARREDAPRNWIARDAELIAIARFLPRDAHTLSAVTGLSPAVLARASALLQVINTARTLPITPVWPVPFAFSATQSKLLSQLSAHVRTCADEVGVSVALLVTRRDLERLIAGERALPVLTGWRNEVVGRDLLAQVDGHA